MVNMVSSDDGQFFGFYTMQCIWFVPLFQRNMLPSPSGLIRIRWMLKWLGGNVLIMDRKSELFWLGLQEGQK